MWEISENLYCAELTVVQRSEQVADGLSWLIDLLRKLRRKQVAVVQKAVLAKN